MEANKYSYDRFGSQGSRVGQAVYDILSKQNEEYTAEEILEGMGKKIVEYLEEAVNKGSEHYKSAFKIIHFFRKTLTQHDMDNVMSQKAHCFVEGPTDPKFFMDAAVHPAKSLFEVDPAQGTMKLLWTIPGWEDCRSILKNPAIYDPDLVKWVKEATRKEKAA